jgi:hypothetical protein
MALGATAQPVFALNERMSMPSDSPKLAQSGRSEPLPLPRDPDIAVKEEFDAARAHATVEAWELFLARHGNHRLAAEARKELERLRQNRAR